VKPAWIGGQRPLLPRAFAFYSHGRAKQLREADVPEQVVRTVTENGRTLKFITYGFEQEQNPPFDCRRTASR
jgi:hypothetical protein